MSYKVLIVGEYDESLKAVVETGKALTYSADYLRRDVRHEWVSSTAVDGLDLSGVHGLWIAPGHRAKNLDAVLRLLAIGRENSIPTLGTCRGYQYMVLEFARNVLGVKDASHGAEDPGGPNPFLTQVASNGRNRRRTVEIDPATVVSPIYPSARAIEKFYAQFGVNPDEEERLADAGFVSFGSDLTGNYRIGGVVKHPFYVGTLYVPQMRSSKTAPHPMVTAFLKVVVLMGMNRRSK